MKRIACLLMAVLLAVPAMADSICFEEPTARKLLTDLEVGEQSTQKLAICDSLTGVLKQEKIQQAAKIAALQSDKAALTEAEEALKGLAEEQNKGLEKCEASKPSRLTWFALGVASAFLTLIGGMVATK